MKINRRGAVQNVERDDCLWETREELRTIGPLLGRFSFFLEGMVIIQTKYFATCFFHLPQTYAGCSRGC